jgi:hypothetical protein
VSLRARRLETTRRRAQSVPDVTSRLGSAYSRFARYVRPVRVELTLAGT